MWGDTLEGGDTRVKAIKSDSDSNSDQKKVARFFRKNSPILVTPLHVAVENAGQNAYRTAEVIPHFLTYT